MSEPTKFYGHGTMADGTHVPLSQDEVKALWDSCQRANERRAEAMPDTVAALSTICDGRERLLELGWREATYCPKDGSVFAIIQYGSTGIFYASYHGEWPSGKLLSCDHFSHPHGSMWKAVDKLNDAERVTLEECEKRERQMADREMRAFAALEKDPAHD